MSTMTTNAVLIRINPSESGERSSEMASSQKQYSISHFFYFLSPSCLVSSSVWHQVGGLQLSDRYLCLSDIYTQAGRSQSDRKSTRLNSSHVSISYAV